MNLTSEQQRMADAIRDLIHGDTGKQTPEEAPCEDGNTTAKDAPVRAQ